MVSPYTTAEGAGPDTAAQEREAKIDLRDFFGILRARLPFIIVPTIVVLLLSVLYLATATRIYTGVTSLLIDARVRPAVGDVANPIGSSPDAVLVESQVRLISSDSVLRRVVEAEGLASDPEFAPTGVGLRTRILMAFGLGSQGASADDRIARATLALASHVVVNRSERTYIADIEVTSVDPLKAAWLADAVAKAYLADQQGARNDAAERDSDWVRQQIGEMQATLQDAELKAEAYRRSHGLIGTNGKLLNEQELADASADLTQARSKATEVKARLDQIRRITTAGQNIDTLPDALKSPLIDKLRGQYADISRQQATLRQTLGDRHPALLESGQQLRDIRRLLVEELTRLQAGIGNEYQTAQANVAALDKHVQELKQAAGVSNEDRVKLDELQRDVDARRAVYDRFLRARDTVREQAVDAPIGRVIAPARIPVVASSPKAFAVLALALAAGLGLGVACALIADLMLDRSGRGVVHASPIAAPDHLPANDTPEPKTAVPVLGFVPSPFGNPATLTSRSWLLDRMRTAWPTTIDTEHVPSLPAFRTSIQALGLVATGVQAPVEKPRTLLVTSVPGFDSRTMLALGLAEAAAGQGRRAMVIDAEEEDGLLRELVTPEARPALIDLVGTTRLCYRIVAPFRGSLSIVPVMAGEAQLARRLGSQSSTLRIKGLSTNFDFVVFDGPDMSQPERLRIMAGTVDTVVVVAPKSTTRDDLDSAIAALNLPAACSIAAVLAADLAEGAAASVAA